jgi:hypothetical protein
VNLHVHCGNIDVGHAFTLFKQSALIPLCIAYSELSKILECDGWPLSVNTEVACEVGTVGSLRHPGVLLRVRATPVGGGGAGLKERPIALARVVRRDAVIHSLLELHQGAAEGIVSGEIGLSKTFNTAGNRKATRFTIHSVFWH